MESDVRALCRRPRYGKCDARRLGCPCSRLRCWCSAQKRGQSEQALGYSRGGFSSKIHLTVDASGNPLRLLLTAGQAHEAPQAKVLLEGYEAEFVIGDKAYDAQHIRDTITQMAAEPVIPPRSNRKEQREYDQELYKERHLIECFISKLKQYRRCFSRFDKLARTYLSFLHFASALIWLR